MEIRTKETLTAAIRAHGRTALVVNVRSRRGRRHFSEVRDRLQAAGLDLMAVWPVSDPARLPHTLASAASCGADLVVVGGGDGTLSEASHQLAHRDVCLGVLPLGTTNNFARSLGLPLNLSKALRTLTEGKVADVDLGHVAGRHFANLTSLGLSVLVAEHVPHRLKRILGRAAYPLTALALLPRHQPFSARLTVDGKLYELATHQLNIANGSFHAGRAIAADAGVDDRLLVVYRLGDANRLRLTAATVRQAVLGPYRALARTPFLTADRLSLETDPPLDLDIDGEIRGRTPVEIHLEANALRVMVNPSFRDM
ncbi:YegS/Rv2252/BmrU family lipid kinase [Pseudonocardia hierapolitana]|uniref:YegS/Rv2252/BmrU family lipid kinase n=1 Tax=Pseudonocardia hierapolitana TaxID=1128676 RepID=A0A561SNS5_9PSEU|nr:YegS/Rv2252/BmrU family lipid kinase [Pseudonocardia hierapolitana]TWF76513.1 YegS/Rv2252/BmrU family lipid kinase [Pseudonocardia hierapolitana]